MLKYGCGLLIAAIILIAIISNFSPKPSPQQMAVSPAVSAAPPVTVAPPVATASPVTTTPSMDAAELRKLTEERQYAVDILTTVQGILSAPSFSARAELYCSFTIEKTEELTAIGGLSGKRLEARYQELLNAEPTTQEGELQRQQQMRFLENLILTHRENLSQCQELLVNGIQKMPTDQELQAKAAQAQQQIANIDQQIGAGAATPKSDATPSPADSSQPNPGEK
jgi:hypothetical protein